MSVTGHIVGNWNLSGEVNDSGGTNVVPNPPEEATDSLEKVAIDDVVYSITGEQEQADWDQSDPTAVDYIKNKPTIPAAQVNSDWDAASGVAQILNKPTLSTVATSGDYDDLINKPTIPAAQVNSDWDAASGVAQILNKPTLSAVATSGSYTDLTNKPTIPAAQVNSDWDAASGVAQILNKPTLSAVATSGEAEDVSYDNTVSGMAATDVQAAVDELKSNLSQLYGVGAIWMTLSNLDPNNFMEGTWIKVEGQFLLGSGSYTESGTTYSYTTGNSGGEVKHKLTASESGCPSHGHNFSLRNSATTGSYYSAPPTSSQSGTLQVVSGLVNNSTAMDATSSHNNMPPYLVVNIWKRTA